MPELTLTLESMAADLRPIRRATAQDNFAVFRKVYLAHHFHLPPSSMHAEVSDLLIEASRKRAARIAVAAPRGYAKSTLVCLAYVLWCIARGTDPYIILISNTTDQVEQLISSIKRELEDNPRLLEDFPEMAEPPGRRPAPKRWRARDFLTRNGVQVSGLGAGQRLRGRKHGKDRPSLIILDDIEGEAEVNSAELRAKRLGWFERAVLKAGDTTTNVIVVGTLLHYDSLLTTLVGVGNQPPRPGWTTRRYQAVVSWSTAHEEWESWMELYKQYEPGEIVTGAEVARFYFQEDPELMLKGAEVLWPEKESYYALMEMRMRDGARSFDCEKQNDPIRAEHSLFDPESLVYWDEGDRNEERLRAELGGDVDFFGACDPSLGKDTAGSDFTAIITLLRHHGSGRLYVLDAIIQKCKPSVWIQMISALNSRRHFHRFAFEANQFQSYLLSEIERQCEKDGYPIPLDPIQNHTSKIARIQGLEPLVKTGRLVFSRKHRLLLDQLRQFPRGAHDDGPDALEMAVQVARSRPCPQVILL